MFIFGTMSMKIPCELVVWYVLPAIRREIANELVTTYKMPQSQVAKKFGVTDAAVSQYMKKKRGENSVIEQSPTYAQFKEEIKKSAGRIVNENADFSSEICKICGVVKELGILAKVYETHTGEKFPEMSCHKVSIQQ